ncbi:4F2 cell-surface antigen heavy chain [Merluccius polli]|uniref:4F2 cell-surface antigen heavy chain n=1 Tax=Merluccius polli TaxID=89951 RepID=A0AA47MZF7_MERPO|nr:4F2 cell-surface antigen heavy chain [Merluccius polli]
MPVNAGYGSIAAAAAAAAPRRPEDAESAALLPAEEPSDQRGASSSWQPLTKEELQGGSAGSLRWAKVRSRLVLLFWLSWLAMLGAAVAIVVVSPRPVAAPLRWWQTSPFYRLRPALLVDPQPGRRGGVEAVCERLSYIKALGVGAMILEGLFHTGQAPDGPVLNDSLVTAPQMQHLLKESGKAGKVVLDLCDLNLTAARPEAPEVNDTSVSPEKMTTVQYALKSWLEKGVAGFAICDTDPAYSEETLTEWRLVLKEFSEGDHDRIVLVKQTGEFLNSTRSFNGSLVEVMMRSILPPTHHILSAEEVAETVEARLQASEGDVWPSWMVGGKPSSGLQKLLLVLIMTLPGTPALQYGEEISNTREKQKRLALFTSLRLAKAREEALLSGSFTMLSFNASAAANSTLRPPVLGFLRSWGCSQFLVVLNIGPDPHHLDPHWARSLPGAGVFVTSTGLDRVGSVSLYASLTLRPQEAIVIKLIEAKSYS